MDIKISAIVEIITKEWLKQKSPSKRIAYRKVIYTGLSMDKPDMTLKKVGDELSMSVSGVSKLHQRWLTGKDSNPIYLEAIKLNVGKPTARLSKKMKEIASTLPKEVLPKEEPINVAIQEVMDNTPDPKRIVARSFGFEWTAEDMAKYHNAIRSAKLFWKKYDTIGRKPRMSGEYYAPGTNPHEQNDGKTWMSGSSASAYTGMSEQFLSEMAICGRIERREYRRSANRVYYEYNLDDLDKLMASPHKDILK